MGVQETAKSVRVFRFGVFEVDAATGELRKQGLRIRLQEQPSQILLMLLDRAGEVVSREEMSRKLWPPDTFVDFDQSLGTALRKLRQALSDDADAPRYIETIPKNGFRFLGPVERISAVAELAETVLPMPVTGPPPSGVKAEPDARRRIPSAWWALLAGACVLSFSLGWVVHTRPAALDGGGSTAWPLQNS
jgi:DNA-binding winged helix-turn-helix (wHTH) protein